MGEDCSLFLLPTSNEPTSTRPFYAMPPTVQGMGKMKSYILKMIRNETTSTSEKAKKKYQVFLGDYLCTRDTN